MHHIKIDTNLVCYGLKDTIDCMVNNQIDTLIVYEDSDYQYVELQSQNNTNKQDKIIKYLKLKDVQYKSTWVDKSDNSVYYILSYDSIVDYLGE